jgi:AraC-like DNA-binding protein
MPAPPAPPAAQTAPNDWDFRQWPTPLGWTIPKRNLRFLERVDAYINKQYATKDGEALREALKVDNIAKHFKMSRKELDNRFYSLHRRNMLNYLIEYRYVKICEFLALSDLSEHKLVKKFGYAHRLDFHCDFYRVFRTFPGCYRKAMKA